MRLFVGGLSYSTSTEGLRSLFAPSGDVLEANVISDRDSGQSKGFGFVEMSDGDARAAISSLNGKMIDGRALTVNEAKPRESRSGGGNYSSGGRW